MSDLKDPLSFDDLTVITGEVPVDGHDAWVRKVVEKRLARKNSGEDDYRSLDDVAAEFGFNAR